MDKRIKVLFRQMKTYREETLSLVKDITTSQADYTPDGFNNNIRWNLGHIYLDQYLWIQTVTKERDLIDDSFTNWFGFGTNPDNFSDETPSLNQLIILLNEQPKVIETNYITRMDEEFEPTEMGIHTVEQALIRTIYHEGLHAATIQIMKRFLPLI
ncbi:DinB superfamily protein [Oceanobacillus limi]|uniref:DinB superfamily protein n=1 Tax=Oceanobacillus limi TaxID=930131 RepID=A0A1I0H700_9BACI|nr:DinB family protein [Oceanobacillus limi]SET78597.1 DinB superfamily protein [Oceanobacillus limi]